MGTSQSKPPAPGRSPLVPAHGDQDPAPPNDPNPGPIPDPNLPPDPGAQEPPPGNAPDDAPQNAPPAPPPALPARHNAAFRRALRDFMRTGSGADGRRALGHYARGAGGGSSGGAKFSRASRSAGSAFAGMARASQGQGPVDGSLDLRTLAGRSVADAISAIVDAFCPPGILSEDVARSAMAEGLAEGMEGVDLFDPAALNEYSILLAARVFVAELVFATMAAEQGQSADEVPASQAVAREEILRSLVREVTDVVGTPILQQVGASLDPTQMDSVVKRVITAVNAEMAKW